LPRSASIQFCAIFPKAINSSPFIHSILPFHPSNSLAAYLCAKWPHFPLPPPPFVWLRSFFSFFWFGLGPETHPRIFSAVNYSIGDWLSIPNSIKFRWIPSTPFEWPFPPLRSQNSAKWGTTYPSSSPNQCYHCFGHSYWNGCPSPPKFDHFLWIFQRENEQVAAYVISHTQVTKNKSLIHILIVEKINTITITIFFRNGVRNYNHTTIYLVKPNLFILYYAYSREIKWILKLPKALHNFHSFDSWIFPQNI